MSGMGIEIGFDGENPDGEANDIAVGALGAAGSKWRKSLGAEAEIGEFYGAANWRRVSEAWIEPDLDDPELPFEVASRLVDYLTALEPVRAQA